MSDLFIIGNGFDRAHGMETSYHDFHQFIKDNCKNMPYIGVVELVSQDSENKIDGMIVYEIGFLSLSRLIVTDINLHHAHPFGTSKGISSSIHFTVPSCNFS